MRRASSTLERGGREGRREGGREGGREGKGLVSQSPPHCA
jgi:hypothetical protein